VNTGNVEAAAYREVLEETFGLLGGVLSGRHIDLPMWRRRLWILVDGVQVFLGDQGQAFEGKGSYHLAYA
jgi:hypothetical protein